MSNTNDHNGAVTRRQWWFEPAIAVFCLVITGMLWQFLRGSERAHVRRMSGLVAEAMRADIDADLTSRVSSLRQMARLWEMGSEPTTQDLQSHGELYITQNPGCQAVDWIDPANRTRRVAPPRKSAGGQEPSAPQAELRGAMEQAVAQKDAALAIAPGEGSRSQLVSILPLYRDAAFQGLLVATCDLKDSLDSMLEDTKGLGYAVEIYLGDKEFYRVPVDLQAGEQEWSQAVDLSRPAIRLRVKVWPKAAVLAELNSHVPETALFVGVLMSILLVMSFHFAQAARAESRRVDLVNRKLSGEIAERRQTEAALKASQARLAGILEISPDAVVSVDESQRITLFNQGAERIFGYRSEEVLGQPLGMLLPQRLRERHHQHIVQFGRDPNSMISMSERGTILGVRKDGSEFPADASLSKLELPEGKLYTAMLRDVTQQVNTERELRRAREELELRIQERTAELATANTALQAEIAVRSETEKWLRESEGRLKAILDNSAAVIYMKDVEGRYLLVNPLFESVFHLSGRQIVGKADHEIFPQETAEAFRENDRQVLESSAPIEFEEVVEQDGEPHTYVAVKFPICDSKGKPYAVCGISTDITKRKQAEDSLRELSAHLLKLQDEERRRIARELHDSTGSHLFALSIYLAKAEGLCGEKDTELRKALESGVQSVEDFSSEIRTLSYLLHPPLLDDLGLVPALGSYVKGFADRSGIRAKFVAQTELGRLPHPTELTIFRIVQEALTNIHHHSGSPSANVMIAKSPAGVVVTISDEGKGFPPEMLAGTGAGGVGIAGMRERVRQLGGTLEIQSGGRGTMIRATLPDAGASAAGAGS